jgi:hypothetical protein
VDTSLRERLLADLRIDEKESEVAARTAAQSTAP